ncbi:unnamed protein product [Clavelina lepadiformis]|uniref:RZ-type domain-containing protein n=1 Tax=Clavelina lepadiformis TaxID=159417 RepID=A0ABP0FR76_CLALP
MNPEYRRGGGGGGRERGGGGRGRGGRGNSHFGNRGRSRSQPRLVSGGLSQPGGQSGYGRANTNFQDTHNHRHQGRGHTSRGFEHSSRPSTTQARGRGFRGHSRPRDAEDENDLRPIAYKALEEMLSEDVPPRGIAVRLSTERSGFSVRLRELNDDNHGMIQMILKVIGKMCTCDEDCSSINKVLQDLINHDFQTKAMKFINELQHRRSNQEAASGHIHNTLLMMQAWFTYVPNSCDRAVSLLLPILKSVVDRLHLGTFKNISSLIEEIDISMQELNENKYKRSENKRNNANFQSHHDRMHEEAPPDDYRQISVFPTLDDINLKEDPFVRTNLVNSAYSGTDHYLDVQFRLLREDFVRPLRQGIEEYFMSLKFAKSKRPQGVKVYQDVTIKYPKRSMKGVHYCIQFNVDRLKFVSWQNSKRLMFGNLVCLSSDNFEKHLLFASIIERKPEELSKGEVMVEFLNTLQLPDPEEEEEEGDPTGGNKEMTVSSIVSSEDLKKKYFMVESEAYFEAYRHVLSGLQQTREIPLERYIVHCENTIRPPRYIRDERNISYDFASVLPQTDNPYRRLRTKYEVLDVESWPSSEELGLDPSQTSALKTALTNELAIIQGPPGTGKTHVGLIIMKMLLKNQASKPAAPARNIQARMEEMHLNQSGKIPSGPILVVCYTNHALDQFLEGIANFHPTGLVRVGGRCKTPSLEQYTLYNVSRQANLRQNKFSRKTVYELRCDLDNCSTALESNEKILKASTEDILSVELLMKVESSRNLLQQLYRLPDADDALLSWLGLKKNEGEEEAEADAEVPVYVVTGSRNPQVLQRWLQEKQAQQQQQDFFENEEEEEFNIEGEADFLQDQRMLMVADDGYDDFQQPRQKKQTKQEKISAANIGNLSQESEEDGWQQAGRKKGLKKKLQKEIQEQLNKLDMMSRTEVNRTYDIFKLGRNDRWRLYRRWVSDLRQQLTVDLNQHFARYNHLTKEIRNIRRHEDFSVLETANVIAMTTTGAAKYRDIIYKLPVRIVIVEEAAEVLEAHIVTSMPKTTEHLILIGDHQQLKPSPTVFELARKYHLDISLFERMIKNGIPCSRLQLQHRMRPRIADLLRPHIYDDLRDHASVEKYDDVIGVQRSVFFLNHNHKETEVKDGMSKVNQYEADFMVALCRYLIQQGYHPEQITILTAYVGQLFAFKNSISRRLHHGVRVTAVDNFQGEENDIILLSLVRSNTEGKMGFLSVENRVCVALSRAKKGLFCVGNFKMLKENNSLWHKILLKLENDDLTGNRLPLQCKNHKEKIAWVNTVKDFEQFPEGGCGQPCQYKLPCGHFCKRTCHPDDENHENYRCREPCKKRCHAGHRRCIKKCWEKCKCDEPCDYLLACGHICSQKCHADDPHHVLYKCLEPCTKTCYAGHKECRRRCFESCECGHACEFRLSCGHVCARRCHDDDREHDAYQCMKQCEKTCKYGHKCSKKCCESCQCIKKVRKALPACGHKQIMRCNEDPSSVTCESPCARTLPCGHQCSGKCGYPCSDQCKEQVQVQGKCGHRYLVPCSESANLDPEKCDKKCAEILKCGHPCRGTCGSCFQGRLHEGCGTKCERPLFCGHLCRENCPSNCPPCTQLCKTSCVHSRCFKQCLEPCVLCKEPCQWKCEHFQCRKRCSEPCDRPPCNEPCKKRLKRCGHRCIGLCGEPCPKLCRICDEEKVNEIFFGDEDEKDARFVELSDCGHCFTYEGLDTWFNQTDNESNSKIDIKLKECPRCKTPVWRSTRYGQIVNRQLQLINDVRRKIVGSFDDVQRAKDGLSAAFANENRLSIGYPGEMNKLRASLRLARSLTTLTVVEAQFNCLVKLSNIQQDLPKLGGVGTTPARKKGVINQMQNLVNWLFRERSYFSEQETSDLEFETQKLTLSVKYLLLKDKCRHGMGVYLGPNESRIKLYLEQAKRILFVDSPFSESNASEVKTILKRINELCPNVLPGLGITDHERKMIVQAVGLSKGHWYKCKNGHIYCIGECGGATHQSKCPECKETIGGTSHRLHDDNQVAGEMDGASRSAWDPNTFAIPAQVQRWMQG